MSAKSSMGLVFQSLATHCMARLGHGYRIDQKDMLPMRPVSSVPSHKRRLIFSHIPMLAVCHNRNFHAFR